MKILHTADWHLGRIFYRVHLTEDQAHVLDQVCQVIQDARPDVVIVAGDIYDRAVPPPDAVALLDETVSRIVVDLDVPLVMISGNHDSPDRLGFGARMLARQKLFLRTAVSRQLEPVVLEDQHGPVEIWPVPFADPAVVRQVMEDDSLRDHDAAMGAIVDQINARSSASRRVLVSHIHVEGGVTSDSERPLVVGGKEIVRTSTLKGFDYVALGHLHRPQHLGQHTVRYSGSLLKYSFAEATDHKSLTMIELDDEGGVTVDEIPLSSRRDVRRIEGYLGDLLGEPAEDGREDYLEVTLRDEGPIVDAIGQLRAVYPNVLHIVRPHFNPQDELSGPVADHRRVDAVDIFGDFFEQVVGQPLSSNEEEAVGEIIEEVDRGSREVALDDPDELDEDDARDEGQAEEAASSDEPADSGGNPNMASPPT